MDAKACGDLYLGDVTLKGFNHSGTPTLVSAPIPATLLSMSSEERQILFVNFGELLKLNKIDTPFAQLAF
jgi:hypothetical protein